MSNTRSSQISANYRDPSLLIANQWSIGRAAPFSIINPATEQTICSVAGADHRDLDAMIAAASAAAPSWRREPPERRAKLLHDAAILLRQRAGQIAEMVTLEQGKPLAEARGEVERAADMLDWNAKAAVEAVQWCSADGRVLREPVGPVAAFTPWNVPVLAPARKVGMALAAGCVCILKPAEETPAGGTELIRALVDAGAPPGVLGLALGDPDTISRRLIEAPEIRKITFTGSVPVGKHLAALAGHQMKPATMELGGHNPVIVLEDAAIEAVAQAAVAAKCRNAGQICTSPTRFYVAAPLYEDFVACFSRAAAALRIGDGAEPETQMGPLINSRRVAAIERIVSDAHQRGAQIATGGTRLDRPGFFFSPTLLTGVPSDSSFMLEEPFGPLAAVWPYETVEEAVMRANDSDLGLAAYVFSGSTERAEDVACLLECGVVGLNSFSVSSPDLPFGGVKDSGFGREGGLEGLEAYLTTKALVRSDPLG